MESMDELIKEKRFVLLSRCVKIDLQQKLHSQKKNMNEKMIAPMRLGIVRAGEPPEQTESVPVKEDDDMKCRKRFVWARDSDNTKASEHPAHLLLNNKDEELDTHVKFGQRQLNHVWIEWCSTGAIVQVPKSRIREDSVPRRRGGK